MSEQTNPIISFKNFSFQYRAQKKPTLHDINLDIYPGERVLIAGPSGSGKSTLAACINGLNPFSNPGECTGSLTVDGVDAPNSSIFELSAYVGTVLQDPDGQFIGLTVGEDIAFALENSCVPQKEMHEITRHTAELVGIEKREYALRHALDPLREQYDYIFIDCPPSLELLTLNALCAADQVLIPVQCEYFALEGLSDLMVTLRAVKKRLNPTISIFGVLLTMYDGRTNFSAQVAEEVRRHFPGKVFAAAIPRNVRLSEAPSHGMPVCAYDKFSRGAAAYDAVAQEILAKESD